MPFTEAQIQKKNEEKTERRYQKEIRRYDRKLMQSLRDLQDAENDKRSVFVRNVHFGCTPENLQRHFESCGTISDVIIKTDDSGRPKCYAVVEFLEVKAVQKALLLNGSQLCGWKIVVVQQRSNVPLKVGGKAAPPKVGGKAAQPKLQGPPPARYQPYQLNNNSNFELIA